MEGYGRNDFQVGNKLMTESEARSRGFDIPVGAAGMQQTDTPKLPLIAVSMQHISAAIERLDHSVSNLANKLDPTLYAEPPSPAGLGGTSPATNRRACSQLGSGIDSAADQIESITDRVNALYRRCEL